jgi:hypothetical protein
MLKHWWHQNSKVSFEASHNKHLDNSSKTAGDLADVSAAASIFHSNSVASMAATESDRFEVVPHRGVAARAVSEDPFPAIDKQVSLSAANMLLKVGAQGEQQLRQLDMMPSAKAGAVLQTARRFESSVKTEAQAAQALTLLACVLCIALRGAVTLEARWECIQMLFVVSVSLMCDTDCQLLLRASTKLLMIL